MASFLQVEHVNSLSHESDEYDDDCSPPPKKFRGITSEDTNQNNSSRSCDGGWESWNTDILADKLREDGLGDVAEIFKGLDFRCRKYLLCFISLRSKCNILYI